MHHAHERFTAQSRKVPAMTSHTEHIDGDIRTAIAAFLPMDRRQALAKGKQLPGRATGAVLFADISGFTPLTELLAREFGPQRGAEELTRHLAIVYNAVIAELHRYGGSVIGFSGDAITCWLDADDGLRGAACGIAMQRVMPGVAQVRVPSGLSATLAMKVAVASGTVRRFLVGDPRIQVIEVIAGTVLDQVAAAEHLAQKGDVLLAAPQVDLAEHFNEITWRTDEDTGARTASVGALAHPVASAPWPDLAVDALEYETLRPWLFPAIYERLRSGRGRFIAELRPAVALFVRFGGIDYDGEDDADTRLNAYICWVQTVVGRYDGALLQLTIGDKGSYLYMVFGALAAHEDDAARAVTTALDLQTPPAALEYIGQVEIGISAGRMRAGGSGADAAQTYASMGDATNLAARFMQLAAPGQILVNHAARQLTGDLFEWDGPLERRVKGKSDPIVVYRAIAARARASIRLNEPRYALPMVGRQAELSAIEEHVFRTRAGQGQAIGITAEAGMGKSRLVAEAIRVATDHQITAYGGECEPYGASAGYSVWKKIWLGLFGLDADWETDRQIGALDAALRRIDPLLAPRLPLLGVVLNLAIPDTGLSRSFDAKLRKSSLESLLVDCLLAFARERPLLLVLEDCHWLDPLSHDLLEVIARAIAQAPVLLLMSYRPPDLRRLQELRVSSLPHFTEIRLSDLARDDVAALITLKMQRLHGPETAPPQALVERITERADGNPFYVEELLNYLHDRGLDPRDARALSRIEVPTTLHSLILSRIDQLPEGHKTVLKVASVIGRQFRAAWLTGSFPELGEPEQVTNDLMELSRLDLTPVDKPEPDLAFLFKHNVTWEVSYESLPFATRSALHDPLGRFIERTYADSLDQYVDLLAFHFERTENLEKKREYLLKAGQAAQAGYANDAAFGYYQRVLPLLPESEQIGVMQQTGAVLELMGRWSDAATYYQDALRQAEQIGASLEAARSQAASGELLRKRGSYAEAANWLDRARAGFEELGDRAGVARVLQSSGSMAAQQGEYETARSCFEESLTIRKALDDPPHIADLLNNLAIVARFQGDLAVAAALHEEALALRRALGNRSAIAMSLNNLGNVALDQGQQATARAWLQEAVAMYREIGYRWGLANALNNLANVVREQGEYATARALYDEGLRINRELGDSWAIAYLLEDIGCLAAAQGEAPRAWRLVGAARTLRDQIRAPLSPVEQSKLDSHLAPASRTLSGGGREALLAEGREMPLAAAIAYALREPAVGA